VQKPAQLLILRQQLRVLLQHHLHLLLQLAHLPPLHLQDRVLLLQHRQLGTQRTVGRLLGRGVAGRTALRAVWSLAIHIILYDG
jgi:hypothetical protein